MRQIRVRLDRSGQDGLWMCGDPPNVVGKLGLCIDQKREMPAWAAIRLTAENRPTAMGLQGNKIADVAQSA